MVTLMLKMDRYAIRGIRDDLNNIGEGVGGVDSCLILSLSLMTFPSSLLLFFKYQYETVTRV